MPEVGVRNGGAHRFLPSGLGLVYLQQIETKDFWLLDLVTGTRRQLTHLSDRGYLNTFDITPDGKFLVFDRSRQNSDVVLIDLPAKVAPAVYSFFRVGEQRGALFGSRPSIEVHAVGRRDRRHDACPARSSPPRA